MRLFLFLWSTSRRIVWLAITASLIAGVASAAFIAIITHTLTVAGATKTSLPLLFFALCILVLVSRVAARVLLDKLAEDAVFDLRKSLCERILATPIERLERLGAARLTAALSQDVTTITQAAPGVPMVCSSLAILAGLLTYGFLLSPRLFPIALAFLASGVVSNELIVRRASRYMNLAREEEDILYGHFRALTEGAKELKLNGARRRHFLKERLLPVAASDHDHAYLGHVHFTVANALSNLLFFVAVGLVLFVVPQLMHVGRGTQVGYTVMILYLQGPLETLLLWNRQFVRAAIALDAMARLGLDLSEYPGEGSRSSANPEMPVGKTVRLNGVAYQYGGTSDERGFRLGPIDLTMGPSQLIFVLGGNGSGKTTFCKLLTGLYFPSAGEVSVDGASSVTQGERYRAHFSAVFSDFYLFEDLACSPAVDDAEAIRLLDRFHLGSKVSIENGRFTNVALSQGQRKRLALIGAYLEDRPICVFDEWAADQDPLFKDLFYTVLLPELKRKGKTVIVITHDDRYFHLADMVVRLENGMLAEAPRSSRPPSRAHLEKSRETA